MKYNEKTIAQIFGSVLCELRKERGMTRVTLSKVLNVSKSTITHYEKGETYPPINMLVAIADYFNVSTDYLLGRCSSRFRYTQLEKKFDDRYEYGDFYAFLDSIPIDEREHFSFLFNKFGMNKK